MSIVYVTEQGALLTKKDGRLVITKDKQVIGEMPLMHVEQIVAFGNVHLSTPLVAHCLGEKVDVCYLSQRGTYRGRLMPEMTRDVRLRQRQYRQCAQSRFALNAAQSIVSGKIYNQIVFCQRRQRDGESLGDALRQLTALRQRVQDASGLDALLGIEGAASNVYFRVFAQALRQDLPFPGQRERPARDPINSMLNLGYTLLYNNIFAALNVVGLDPYMGCYHQPKHGHASLASDLIEEFRPVIVDAVVVLMVNHKEVSLKDFRRLSKGEMRFTDDALRRFIARYDGRLDTQVFYAPLKARYTYRQILELQARQFARLVMGEEKEYVSYRWDW
jgi:CRISPR-associated protein Cas1